MEDFCHTVHLNSVIQVLKEGLKLTRKSGCEWIGKCFEDPLLEHPETLSTWFGPCCTKTRAKLRLDSLQTKMMDSL